MLLLAGNLLKDFNGLAKQVYRITESKEEEDSN